jgi:CRP-like cAMP-binding protein
VPASSYLQGDAVKSWVEPISGKSKIWYLKYFNIFEGMSDAQMKQVESISSMSEIEKSRPIYFPEQPSGNIYFLKEGHVRLFRLHEDGREVILDILGPGEIFGELSLTDEGMGQDFASALDKAIICTVRKSDFEQMLLHNPEMNLRLTRWFGLRLRKFEEKINDLAFKDVAKRIIGFVARYAGDFGKMKSGIVTVKSLLSHQDIAYLTASSRQTVTTTLNDLRERGIISFDRKQLRVLDMEKLKALSR